MSKPRDTVDLLAEASADGTLPSVLLTQAILASSLPAATLRGLWTGKAPIREREAKGLEQWTGRPASYWLRAQELHDAFLAQEAEESERLGTARVAPPGKENSDG